MWASPAPRAHDKWLAIGLLAAYMAASALAGGVIVASGAVPPWREGSPFEYFSGAASMLAGAVSVLAHVAGSSPASRPLDRLGVQLGLMLVLVGFEETAALHELVGSERLTDFVLWLGMGFSIWSVFCRLDPGNRLRSLLWLAWCIHGFSALFDEWAVSSVLSREAAVWIDEFLEFSYVPLYALGVLALARASRGDGRTGASLATNAP
jgi:hypothetical protein